MFIVAAKIPNDWLRTIIIIAPSTSRSKWWRYLSEHPVCLVQGVWAFTGEKTRLVESQQKERILKFPNHCTGCKFKWPSRIQFWFCCYSLPSKKNLYFSATSPSSTNGIVIGLAWSSTTTTTMKRKDVSFDYDDLKQKRNTLQRQSDSMLFRLRNPTKSTKTRILFQWHWPPSSGQPWWRFTTATTFPNHNSNFEFRNASRTLFSVHTTIPWVKL